jgi:hypothetical protein
MSKQSLTKLAEENYRIQALIDYLMAINKDFGEIGMPNDLVLQFLKDIKIMTEEANSPGE